MKYEITENVKKSINDFEETLKNLLENNNSKKQEIENAKQKIQNALELIKKMEE
jgi:ElaB/YqjD/DUF883 family membrane-anchored ribosome-binding protein